MEVADFRFPWEGGLPIVDSRGGTLPILDFRGGMLSNLDSRRWKLPILDVRVGGTTEKQTNVSKEFS